MIVGLVVIEMASAYSWWSWWPRANKCLQDKLMHFSGFLDTNITVEFDLAISIRIAEKMELSPFVPWHTLFSEFPSRPNTTVVSDLIAWESWDISVFNFKRAFVNWLESRSFSFHDLAPYTTASAQRSQVSSKNAAR